MNYQQMITQQAGRKKLMSPGNWKWELKGGKPLIFIDTHGVSNAIELVRKFFHGDTSMREENDHLDKNKQLIVVLMENHGEFTIRRQLETLVDYRPCMEKLFCAYVIEWDAMNPLNWRLAEDGVSLQCQLDGKAWRTDLYHAIQKAKHKIMTMLVENLKAPKMGHLYLTERGRHYILVWHSCERCDEPPSWSDLWSERRHWDYHLRI